MDRGRRCVRSSISLYLFSQLPCSEMRPLGIVLSSWNKETPSDGGQKTTSSVRTHDDFNKRNMTRSLQAAGGFGESAVPIEPVSACF